MECVEQSGLAERCDETVDTGEFPVVTLGNFLTACQSGIGALQLADAQGCLDVGDAVVETQILHLIIPSAVVFLKA